MPMKNEGFANALRAVRVGGFSSRRLRAMVAEGVRHIRLSGGLRSGVPSLIRRIRRHPEVPVPAPAPPHIQLIDFVAADIVNNCNLRCPFCLVDYDQVHHTQLMDERTFRALLRLAPAVPEGGFWLSCLHEPTLHPKLTEYISWIPRDQRRKFWFTTNLTRPLPDAMIEELAQSGLHHINVSLDTFDPDLFAILRKHGRVSAFRNNLDRLVAAFRRTPGAPALRYITMAFRSNFDEIPDLVRWMNEHGNAWQIEVRFTFNTLNIAEDFRRAQFLGRDDWDTLRLRLAALPFNNYMLGAPPDGYEEEAPTPAGNWFDTYTPAEGEPAPEMPRPFGTPLQLRARPDGRLHINGSEHLFKVNVADLDDPIAYFEEMCGLQPETATRLVSAG